MTPKKFRANAAVSNAVLESLGLPPHDGVPYRSVKVPTGLTVVGEPTGVNTVQWKRNGNVPNTIYFLQRRYGATGEWTSVTATTSVKWSDGDQPVGDLTFYRVFARRGNQTSGFSAEASVYGQAGDNGVFELAA